MERLVPASPANSVSLTFLSGLSFVFTLFAPLAIPSYTRPKHRIFCSLVHSALAHCLLAVEIFENFVCVNILD
jgi:hypothetical protein